jgi:hypothetical protein
MSPRKKSKGHSGLESDYTYAGYLGYPFQNRAVNSTVSNRIVICLKYHWSEKGRDSVLHGAFFRTDILSSQYTPLSGCFARWSS